MRVSSNPAPGRPAPVQRSAAGGTRRPGSQVRRYRPRPPSTAPPLPSGAQRRSQKFPEVTAPHGMMPVEVWTGVQAMGEECSSAITGMSSDLASPSVTRPALARSLVQRAGTRRGMTIVVQGLAGMGKTWFLRELTHRARDAGRWEVSFVSADEVEAHVPYGFLERLLAGWGMAAELDDLLVDDQPAQPVVVGRELVRRQRRGGRSEHRTVIDDAQWIDGESVRVLRYALPRLTSRGLVAAIGVRTPHAPDSFGAHLEDVATDNPLAQLVAIDPLTVAQIHAFVAERL